MSYRRGYSAPFRSRSANTIPAIPASYRGVQFRSIMEVRWAAFFDALGLTWVYEPQTFRTRNGRYTPDFRLPDLGVWWEVKGAAPNPWAFDAALSVSIQDKHPVCISWGEFGMSSKMRLVMYPRETHTPVRLGIPLHRDDKNLSQYVSFYPAGEPNLDWCHPRITQAFDEARTLRIESGA